MRLRLVTCLLFAAAAALGAESLPKSPRPIFPDDYTPQPCAPTECKTFDISLMNSSAARFLGLTADANWFAQHEPDLLKAIAPYCAKRNSCLAVPGNSHMFC